jgi:hypothetical protein
VAPADAVSGANRRAGRRTAERGRQQRLEAAARAFRGRAAGGRRRGGADCSYGACAYPRHDHTTTQAADGGDLDEPVAMFCEHCGQPAHYDEKLRRYRHDDPAAPDCFLISRDPR